MIKYVILACLYLMLILGQGESQDQQEITIDKRVERDVDVDLMSEETDYLNQSADLGNTFSDKVKNVMGIINVLLQQVKGVIQRFSTFGSR